MTAGEVIQCLKARFIPPEWSLVTEFSLRPGYHTNRADAVAMNCWASGKWGCSILGFEIKVSRADFLHEMKHPKKRERTYKGVDALFLAVPKGLVDPREVPKDMGICICSKDADGRWGCRLARMPEGMVLPSARARTSSGFSFDRMPPVRRDLAVSILRALDVARRPDVLQSKDILEGTKRSLRHHLESARRNYHCFPYCFGERWDDETCKEPEDY